jgi:phosphoribosylamine---glycine ligase
MKILIVGGGGREHAMAFRIAASPQVEEVLVAPGNAGTATEPGVRNVAVDADDLDALADLARREAVALTVVGPEQPLVAGIVDHFQAQGLACFGPSAAAARLEGSKAFAKDFMTRHGIPTAAYARFDSLQPALEYVRSRKAPIVVKADGLAAGKGVTVAASIAEAEQALHDMLEAGAFGAAGAQVVVEDFLHGEEASFIALVDGTHILPLASSQDHKARDEGDRGPNTGGMGAYSPAPVVTDKVHQRIMDEVMVPVVRGLAADGMPYRGFLYAGLMIDEAGAPSVVEFNCRLGDPETQPILSRLNTDLVTLLTASMEGTLDRVSVEWDPRAAVGVVLASGGYPGSYRKGDEIHGLDRIDDPAVKIFHAGTKRDTAGRILTDGGRVLCAVGLGDTVADARDRVYKSIERISWDGMYYRRDIAHRALTREAGA